MTATVEDRRGRPLRDLRISLTDRCNFRCPYCMPRELFGPGHAFLPAGDLLSFEEINRLVRAAARLGVRKVRLTGGEPLLRPRVSDLVAVLAGIDGIDDLAMTTNGTALATNASSLAAAGLSRLTISLDSLDDSVFRALNGVDVPLEVVLRGIAAALSAGFAPFKLNAVIRRDVNVDGVVDLARYGREIGAVVRFIEYMDVGTTNGWRAEHVVPASEIVERIGTVFPMEPAAPTYRGEVARRYRYRDGGGEIGVISSVTQPFCGDCTRLRLSADGRLYILRAARGAPAAPATAR